MESHWLVLVQSLAQSAAEWQGSRALQVQLEVSGYLVRAYRQSQSAKQRQQAIMALGELEEGVLEESLTPEEKELVVQYRRHTKQAQDNSH